MVLNFILKRVENYKIDLQKIKLMGIQELIQIVYQCRLILREMPQSEKTYALLQRIDKQIESYSQYKHVNKSFDNVSCSQSRSRSKKKIFQVFSKDNNSPPIKKKSNQLSFSHSEIKQSSTQDHYINLSMQISKSQVSQISLNNVRLNTTSIIQESFENLCQSTTIVNNSFDNNNILKDIQGQRQEKFINPQSRRQRQIQIEDFFIIDYNFEKKDYEILPRRQNFKEKCEILDDLEIQSNKQGRPKLHMLKKHSSTGTKQAVNPFQQIIDRDSMNRSQLSMDSIMSLSRYSMQPQVNSNKSRIMLDSSHIKNQNDIQELYQIREVIMNLVLDSTPMNHIREIKATSSMTDLLKLTTNPSSKNKTLQHIVIPSCLDIRTLQNAENCNKYTHVIKTHQGISFGMRYYECQRFFVIVEKNRNFLLVQNIIQALIKKAYEIRVKSDGQVDNVFYSNIRRYIQQISLIPKKKLSSLIKIKNNEFFTDSTYSNAKMSISDPLYQVSLYCQAAINFQFTLQLSTNSSSSKCFHLVLILIYFVIFQYKIVFLTTKGYENTVSQIINTLIHMIGDLRYIYPVIMAMLTNHHIQFVHAPIPGILALWGKQSRCKKAIQFMKRKLKDQAQEYMASSTNSSQNSNSLPTIVIDMNKHQFVQHSFTHKQFYIIQNLQNYAKRSNKYNNFFDKMNYFFNEILLKDNVRNTQTQEKWILILRQRLRNTQMYEEYMKFQQTLKKVRNSKLN